MGKSALPTWRTMTDMAELIHSDKHLRTESERIATVVQAVKRSSEAEGIRISAAHLLETVKNHVESKR